MLVAVDIGNSAIKLGLFDDFSAVELTEPVKTLSLAPGDWRRLEEWLPQEGCCWLVASVQRTYERQLSAWVAAERDEVYQQVTYENLPIRCPLPQPERVGADRLAGAVAAKVLKPTGRGAIVIDSGSAITVDYVTPAGEFAGGAILPGVGLAAKFLAQGTDLLPHVAVTLADPAPAVIGTNTQSALASGLIWGAVGGVREIVHRINAQVEPLPAIYCTGGGGANLAAQLGGGAEFLPHLVLQGIALAAHNIDCGE